MWHVYSQKYLRNLMFVVYLPAGILSDLCYLYEFPWLIAQEQQISSQVQLSATQTLQKQSNAVVTTIIVLWADRYYV